ncbi:natriuretic peptides B [Peromyscus californicus insignis]|uniref:natriuretic peptides B n=1 Tax=Peromyscus californicus insignis TaxID=564181 RepID=UPI0022A6CD50|nr:natriuretic peptides B [Peromyscus californicus insignis]
MDLQKVLSRMILFLLFLSLSLLGGHSHPLSSPSQSPEQVKMQALLDLLKEKAEEVPQGQLLKDQDTTKASLKSTLGSQDSTFQILQRIRSSKKMHTSSCFGHRIDRIGSVSRLGCNVLKRY